MFLRRSSVVTTEIRSSSSVEVLALVDLSTSFKVFFNMISEVLGRQGAISMDFWFSSPRPESQRSSMSSNIIWNVFVYHNMAPTLYLRIFFKCFYLKDMTLIQFSETANHTCCSPWTAATLRLFWCVSCASGGLPPSPGRCQCFAQIAANIKGRSIVVHSSG